MTGNKVKYWDHQLLVSHQTYRHLKGPFAMIETHLAIVVPVTKKHNKEILGSQPNQASKLVILMLTMDHHFFQLLQNTNQKQNLCREEKNMLLSNETANVDSSIQPVHIGRFVKVFQYGRI